MEIVVGRWSLVVAVCLENISFYSITKVKTAGKTSTETKYKENHPP